MPRLAETEPVCRIVGIPGCRIARTLRYYECPLRNYLNEKSKERFSSRAFVSSTLASARIRSSSVLYLRLTAPPTPDRRFEPAASCDARAGAGAGSGFEANDAGVNDFAY